MNANNSIKPPSNDFSSIELSKDLVDSICCPVLLEPFKKAQMLNCAGHHSLSLAAAQEIFGEMQANGQCTKPNPCPLCRGRITTYHSNPALQSIVDSILGVDKGQFHLDKMNEVIRKLKIDFDDGIKYPLQKSLFKLRDGFVNKGSNYMLMTFDNQIVSEKVIQMFHCQILIICNKPQFIMNIRINNEESRQKFLDYFNKNSLSFKQAGFPDTLGATLDQKSFMLAFRLITQANDFEKDGKAALQEFIQYMDSLAES